MLLIGASRGLGLALAREWARGGRRVVATVRGPGRTPLHDLAETCAEQAEQIEIETVDVTEPAQIAALRDRLADRMFDLLFVNAGVTNEPDRTVAQTPTGEFIRVMVTNALGPLRVIEALQDRAEPAGTIGVMSSGQGSVANNERGGHEVYRGSGPAPRRAPDPGPHGPRLGAHRARRPGRAAQHRPEHPERRQDARRPAGSTRPALRRLPRPNGSVVNAPGSAGRSADPGQQAWALMQRFVEAHNRRGELAEALGFRLGGGRGKILFQLRDGPATLGQLAAANGIEAPYATLIVDRLEAHGLVERHPHPGDRRRKLVALTAAGHNAIATADAILLRPPPAISKLPAGDLGQLTGLRTRRFKVHRVRSLEKNFRQPPGRAAGVCPALPRAAEEVT